jgi:hypothetical protein
METALEVTGAEFPPQMVTAEAVVRGRECIN